MKTSIFVLYYLSFFLNWLLILPGSVIIVWQKQKILLYLLGLITFFGSLSLISITPHDPNGLFPRPEFTAITIIVACGIQLFVIFMNIKNAYDKYMRKQYSSEGS